MRKKAQMEDQINALNKQIYKEKAAWVTTRNTPLLQDEIARYEFKASYMHYPLIKQNRHKRPG